MKKLLIGVLAIGTLTAQASMLEISGPLDGTLSKDQLNVEKTHYETLGDLFKAGTLPKFSKISNIAWAGRCFNKSNPNDPTNAGYIFRPKRNDAGPIASKVYEALSYWSPSKAPNYYDKMNIEQILAIPDIGEFKDAKITENSIETDVTYPYKSYLKVSGNYLVEEISVSGWEVAGKVIIEGRCYYFIPDFND